MSAVTLNLAPLKALRVKAAELGDMRAQVGLFGDTAGRSAEPGRIDHNPSLGAIHEFGLSYSIRGRKQTVNIPERSFLRMPLTLHLGRMIQSYGDAWFRVLIDRGAKRTMNLLGIVGEDIVQQAFATRGYGHWPLLHPRTIRRKKSAAVLIESSKLRKAVSSRVV